MPDGCKIRYRFEPRREGDPPRLVAEAALPKAELGWTPRYAAVDTIIEHAWRWEQQYFVISSPATRTADATDG